MATVLLTGRADGVAKTKAWPAKLNVLGQIGAIPYLPNPPILLESYANGVSTAVGVFTG